MNKTDFPIKRVTKSTVSVLNELVSAELPLWGLQISKNTGFAVGTVYPILEKLENSGWLIGDWEETNERTGPRRRYYSLNNEVRPLAIKIIDKFENNSKPVNNSSSLQQINLA